MSKNHNYNNNNKGCRGCRYLETIYINVGWIPWECWYPRSSKTSPVRVDLERFRIGCKGRTVAKVDKRRTGEKKGL